MLTIDIEIMEALGLGVLVHAEVQPSDKDWESTVQRWDRFGRRVRAAGRQPSCLALSPGGEGPNARQRRLLDDVNREIRPRVAVASSSSIARGIVTAIAWFGHTEIRSFQPHELDAALAYLSIPVSERPLVERAIASTQKRLVPRSTGT